MPLIALDILEGKIKELTVVIKHLKEENDTFKSKLDANASGEISPEVVYELDKMKNLVSKYKNERIILYKKIAEAIKKIDEATEKKPNG